MGGERLATNGRTVNDEWCRERRCPGKLGLCCLGYSLALPSLGRTCPGSLCLWLWIWLPVCPVVAGRSSSCLFLSLTRVLALHDLLLPAADALVSIHVEAGLWLASATEFRPARVNSHTSGS